MHAGCLHLSLALKSPPVFFAKTKKKDTPVGCFRGKTWCLFAGVRTTSQTAGRRLCLPSALSTNSSRQNLFHLPRLD